MCVVFLSESECINFIHLLEFVFLKILPMLLCDVHNLIDFNSPAMLILWNFKEITVIFAIYKLCFLFQRGFPNFAAFYRWLRMLHYFPWLFLYDCQTCKIFHGNKIYRTQFSVFWVVGYAFITIKVQIFWSLLYN